MRPGPGKLKFDLTGQRFDRLVVLGRVYTGHRQVQWNCQCDCGNTHIVLGHVLKAGRTRSCGCLHREIVAVVNATHKHSRPGAPGYLTYRTWQSMRSRCTATRGKAYRDYASRGIRVCRRWMKFENFLADMGLKPPGLSINRLDNDGNYAPNNCAWSTAVEQANNRRPRRRAGAE